MSAVTVDQIRVALQSAWDDFVADSGDVPACFERRGGETYADFGKGNFALMVAQALEVNGQPSTTTQDGPRSYAKHGTPDYASLTAAGCEASGEPVFLLRAQDRHAAEAVRAWARIVRAQPSWGVEPSNGLLVMAIEAERIAYAMDAWLTKKEPTL